MLKKIIKKLYSKATSLVTGIFWYTSDFIKYRKELKKSGQTIPLKFFPLVFDKAPGAHTFDKHYVYMDRWAFDGILKHHPDQHVDVGSSIRFLSMASCVTKLKFIDIRPIKLHFSNFECIEGSILNMPFANSSVDSLSCLHVAEHIGLGRYGDPLDSLGTVKACKELVRILKPGGSLYFALPVGKTTTYFNAHRVHDPLTILEYFKELKLISFAAVGDDGHFKSVANPADYSNASYACGMFLFTK